MKILLIALPAILLFGCVKNNDQPVWLEISEWTLVQNPDVSAENYGALTHNFKDAWIYVDNKLVGVYELPCKVPVLTKGTKEIAIYPAVRNNGIAATKKIYPFVKPFTVTMDLVPGQKYPLSVSTHYQTFCEYPVLEEFVDPSSSLQPIGNSATIAWENDPAISLSGYYGHIHLNSTFPEFVASITPYVDLPGSNAELYLEIDYITNVQVLHSILAQSSSGIKTNPMVYLNPDSGMEWKKIYIDMKEVVSYSVSATSFTQAFYATLGEETGEKDIYIDNIRIVHQ